MCIMLINNEHMQFLFVCFFNLLTYIIIHNNKLRSYSKYIKIPNVIYFNCIYKYGSTGNEL